MACAPLLATIVCILLLSYGSATSAASSSSVLLDTYRVISDNQSTTSTAIVLGLTKTGSWSIYGSDVPSLSVSVTADTVSRLHVRITDSSKERWEVPQWILPRPSSGGGGVPLSECELQFSYTENPFSFAISRVNPPEVLFNSSSDGTFNNLIYEDQYLEVSTQLDESANIYGFGEQVTTLRWNETVVPSRTLWSLGEGTPVNKNLYASHPFHLQLSSATKRAHGVAQPTCLQLTDSVLFKFLLNSNGMDVLLNTNSLTYKVIGGIFDFYFFEGPQPQSVIQNYHQLIGRPRLPAYWTLGWHQCRWGYQNIEEVKEVVANYSLAKIPLETMWTDIDYMDKYLDFTTDPKNFPGDEMNAFVNQLHRNQQKYVLIIDPGISNQTKYAPYDSGVAQKLFVRDANGKDFIGKVWPGTTVFPDFMNSPVTSVWWRDNIETFRKTVPVDGLWTDMNEVSNFCDGSCSYPPNNNSLNYPPYRINNAGTKRHLFSRTLAMDCVHNNSGQAVLEYNAHSLHGLTETIATCNALEELTNERCFVLSRSTFPGSGAHGGHWLGDNTSEFADMYYSIPGILYMQMFGLSLVGADICGFTGNTTEELCGRWMALGALYPFARNHNSKGNVPQEPYRWKSVADISRKYISLRYSLLPFYYSLFAEANRVGGAQVWQPLFFVFWNDLNTYSIDSQFLIGGFILCTPVLTANATSVSGYFPTQIPSSNETTTPARWYDFYSGAELTHQIPASGYISLEAPIDVLPLHILGGAAILMQQPANTTTMARKQPFTLLCALDSQNFCTGYAYQDDGLSIPSQAQSNSSILFQGVYSNATGEGVLSGTPMSSSYSVPPLASVSIWGLAKSPSSVSVNSKPISTFSFDSSTRVLSVNGLAVSLNASWRLQWT